LNVGFDHTSMVADGYDNFWPQQGYERIIHCGICGATGASRTSPISHRAAIIVTT
jgi:hypothetical protein